MPYQRHEAATKLAAVQDYLMALGARQRRPQSVAEVCAHYRVNSSQLGKWLRRYKAMAEKVFARQPTRKQRVRSSLTDLGLDPVDESDDAAPEQSESAFALLEAECDHLHEENLRLKRELRRALQNFQTVVQQARSSIPNFKPTL